MNYLLFHPNEIDSGGRIILRGRRAVHVSTVLKGKEGDFLRACVARHGRGEAEVLRVAEREVTLRFSLLEKPPVPQIDLVLAVPRPKVLSRCLSLAASLGTRKIHLVNAWRVEKSYFQSPKLETEAMNAAAGLGCEQGGEPWLPEISVSREFMGFVNEVLPGLPRNRVVAHPKKGNRVVSAYKPEPVVFAIGPEGGWIEREIETLELNGFIPCEFGLPTLRVEPAIAALYAQWAMAAVIGPA